MVSRRRSTPSTICFADATTGGSRWLMTTGDSVGQGVQADRELVGGHAGEPDHVV